MKALSLPEKVKYIIEKLCENGYEASVVGGGVRDFILGRASSDYDITTDALPEETKTVFSGERIVETGIKHGTVSLILDGESYEITTYRLDGEYLDNRHPSEVKFTRELSLDTSRRDFTINAICYNPYDGFIDFHGGIEDIKEKLIRTVGDPAQRFSEDALRIMRAIRFAAVLGFDIEKETERAIFSLSNLLSNVSRERIFAEYKKMISGKFCYNALLKYTDVIRKTVPELSKRALPQKMRFDAAIPLVRSISLFESASDYEKAMRSLRSDTKTLKQGVCVLENLNRKTDTRIAVLSLMKELGKENVDLLIKTRILLGLCESTDESLFFEILSDSPCYKLSDLAIDGKVLTALGYKGKTVGTLLDKALTAVIFGKVENEKDALICFVNKNTDSE